MNERFKIAAPIVAVVIALLFVTWAGVLTLAEQVKQREIERSFILSQKISRLFAEQVARTIDSIDSIIDFAAYEIIQYSSADQLKDMADSGALMMKPVLQIAFVDPEGFTVVTNAGADPARTDLSDREHIRVHLDGKVEGLYIGAPVLGRVSGKWSIQLSRKIIDRNGNFFGIIVASLDPFYFEKFWTEALGDQRVTALYRSDGALLTRSEDLLWALENRPRRKDLIDAMGGREMGQIVASSSEGRERLSYFARVPDAPLFVISGEVRSHVFASYSAAQRIYYAVGVVSTLILSGLGAWLVSFAWRLSREEQAARLSEQVARQAEQSKSAFLAAMSHEIRTPLNALVGFGGLLSKTSLDQEQRKYVRTMEAAGQTLRSIVSDVLDFSKLESNALEIENNPFNLYECLSELHNVTSLLVGDKPVKVSMELGSDIPQMVVIDGPRLYQVLLNISGNAAKFTQDGEIFIKTRVAKNDDVEHLVVEVSDTGPGISAIAQEKLFKPFEQGDVAGKLRAAGTGLGLAISKMLLDRMGGAIRVKSAVGQGSTFTIEVPFERYDAKQPADEIESRDGESQPLRILVVDDARASRLLLRILLEKSGHSVVEAEDGVQALEIMREHVFDLVFLDIQMPRLGGLEVAKQVMDEMNAAMAPTIVALSAQAQPEDKKAAAEVGIAFYITKPLHEDDIFKAVRWAGKRKNATEEGR